MIFEFARDFIAVGESMEEKQSRLNAACTAWNIANLPKFERRKALERYLQGYRVENPAVQGSHFLRKDLVLEHLIKQKIRLFPQIKKPIMHAEIRDEGDRFGISAVSGRTE